MNQTRHKNEDIKYHLPILIKPVKIELIFRIICTKSQTRIKLIKKIIILNILRF